MINKKINFFKIFYLIVILFVILIGFISTNLHPKADSIYVYVGGDAIGLDLHTGVYVTGKFDVTNKNDLTKGDILKKIDGIKINSVEDLKKVIIHKQTGDNANIEFIRNGIEMITPVTVCNKNGKNTIGVYVKDNVLGVGTLTYVLPTTLNFGSLGHSACSDVVNVNGGEILKCYINGVVKGIKGVPGEKKAIIDKIIIGKAIMNNDFGVFGTLEDFDNTREKMAICPVSEVKKGKAKIRTVLEGNKIEEFEIEIIEAIKQDNMKTKGIKYIVTDENLINRTGGIIQGMSGSPIIQNDRLIGAVSHVIINDPLTGYGVYAEWMIEFS